MMEFVTLEYYSGIDEVTFSPDQIEKLRGYLFYLWTDPDEVARSANTSRQLRFSVAIVAKQ
jgi:hypothetical protein